jgi:sugar lactone lactonase YvrE
MAIESAAFVRRHVRTGLVVLIGLLSLCGVAMAQKELVTSGSVIPLQHPTFCQIYRIFKNPAGDTLFLDPCGDNQFGAVYQLSHGQTTFQTVEEAINPGQTYWNEDMAMDAKGTLYLTDRYNGTQHIYRVPYNPADGTYDFSASGDNWESTLDSGFEGKGTQNDAFWDSPAKDGSGLLFVSEQGQNAIVIIPVNADGTVKTFASGPDAGQPQFQYLINGLRDKVMPMVTDVNGNLYFIENPYETSTTLRATGVFFVPASAYKSCMAASAAGTTDPTTPCLSGTESSLDRIDPGNTEKFNGLTIDAAGNIYVADGSDQYGGTRNGLLEIPNESGSPVGVTANSFNFGDAAFLAPVAVNANPYIDSRGFIWLPTGTSNNYQPNGSSGIPGSGNLVLWQMGAANVGSTPVGTPTATAGIVFYSFNGSVTPSAIAFSQPGGETDFSSSTTNPYPPTSGNVPAVPCTAGTNYLIYQSCQEWVTFNPQGANAVGLVEGQVSLLDASSKVISGSTALISGIGQGPAVALLVPAMQTPLATGLVSPQQVAGDSLGNSYVADPGQGKVLMFPAGSTTASAGTSIGTGLTAPTGVAVDGLGDVYIGDTGKVIEIPAVNGKLNAAGQTTLAISGLGSNLQLAVDGAGNLYVADPDKARIVRVYNSQMSMLIPGTDTVGSGFTKPTAVAVDNAGDVFVADGTTLSEINAWGGQSAITSNLTPPVTGLAVDPSGSVYVAENNGVVRIPLGSGGLDTSGTAQIDDSGVTMPNGVGIDGLGNLYVTADSYNTSTIGPSGAGTSAVSTPNLLLLSGAFVNFGLVSQETQSDPIDVDVYNIGNAPLAFTGAPTFAGTNGDDYAIQSDGQNPCDTSGATPVASASACQLGVTVAAIGLGVSQGTMAVPTNAANAPLATADLEAYSSDLLCRTVTTITLNPSSGLSYPGSTTVSATTTADPANPCAQGGTPQNGNVVLTLQSQARGTQPSTQTQSLPANGQVTFNLSALNGGTYAVYATYHGDPVYGGSSSSKSFTIQVAQVVPTVTFSEPAGITVLDGNYYLKEGSTATLQAAVSSSLGVPTGSIQFMNGSDIADPKQTAIQLDANGDASFNTSNLTIPSSQVSQTYNLTAVYSGDANFATTPSPIASVVIVPTTGAALITADPAAVTTKAGTPVSASLTVTAVQGYSPPRGAQLYCDNSTLPQYAECTFDNPTLDLADAASGLPTGAPPPSVTSNVTITTNIPINVSTLRRSGSPVAFAGIFGLGLLGLALRKKGKFRRSLLGTVCLLLLLGGGLAGVSGCTNSGYSHAPAAPKVTTPSGTYNVSIYTIDVSTNQKSSLPFTLTLTVQ